MAVRILKERTRAFVIRTWTAFEAKSFAGKVGANRFDIALPETQLEFVGLDDALVETDPAIVLAECRDMAWVRAARLTLETKLLVKPERLLEILDGEIRNKPSKFAIALRGWALAWVMLAWPYRAGFAGLWNFFPEPQ